MPKVKWKGSTLLAPVPPVLVTCGNDEKRNVMTVAWTGIINSQPPKTYISVRPERYSYELISENREFVINLTTAALIKTADFCGVRSGRDINKFTVCKIGTEPATVVACPMITESPLSIE
jgi:flavin reductase (DIM6/NTAB) family NADH-FMN oxidoreductase RutF